jgi:predicted TIM-barrel fold metal-dependent hydrolase
VLIVDDQVHLWHDTIPTVPAHRQIASFTRKDLLKEMDEAGVDAAVVVPPPWEPLGNQLACEAAAHHPARLAALGLLSLDRPAESLDLIDAWKQEPGVVGLRVAFPQPHYRTWVEDGTLDWLWPAAERAGLPISLSTPATLPVIGRVAERHPGLKVAVAHLAMVARAQDEAAFANTSELVALAKHPNIAVNATGAPGLSSAPYPYRNIHAYLRRIYDSFGPERMFWGTDLTRMPCSYRQCVTMFTEELPWLSAGDIELIMGRALCTWLDWQVST